MVTKKSICVACGLAVLFGAIFMFGGTKDASTQLSVGVNLNLGSAPPQEVVMAPGGVYFVPNQSIDVFFYGGYWWAMRDNRWYRSHDYNGTWKGMDLRYVPGPVYRLYGVPNYREVYGKENGNHIPYGQWKKQGYKGNMQEARGNSGEQGNQGNQGNQKGKSGKGNGGKGKK